MLAPYSVLFYLLLPTSGSVLSGRSWRRGLEFPDDGISIGKINQQINYYYSVGRYNITHAGKQLKIGGHASPEGDGKWGFWYQEPNGSGKGSYYFTDDSVEVILFFCV